MTLEAAIQDLHYKCGVYTSTNAAAKLLDNVGWTENADLSDHCLLEPCVGEGAILELAVNRLIKSFRRHDKPLNETTLGGRIAGFELHFPAFLDALSITSDVLNSAGIDREMSDKIAEGWIQNCDFLLAPTESCSMAVANPPYLRWSKIPKALKDQYVSNLDPEVAIGDLSLPFLDRILAWCEGPQTQVCVLTNDRWIFTKYGEPFKGRLQNRGWLFDVVEERPENAFQEVVGAHASIITFSKSELDCRKANRSARSKALVRYQKVLDRVGPLAAANCEVRVGPALGAGGVFLTSDPQLTKVEGDLIRPFISRRSLRFTEYKAQREFVVCPYTPDGSLVDLNDWPEFGKWAIENKVTLEDRSVIRSQGGSWWRTIDKIGPVWNAPEKLLIPEMTNKFKCFIDRTSAIPAHSIYAVFSKEWPLEALANVLNSGLLEITARALAPSMKSDWYRLYKRFLVQVPLPVWGNLDETDRSVFCDRDCDAYSSTFKRVFGVALSDD